MYKLGNTLDNSDDRDDLAEGLPLKLSLLPVGIPVFLLESQSRGIITYNVETVDNGRSYVVKTGRGFVATPHCNVVPLH